MKPGIADADGLPSKLVHRHSVVVNGGQVFSAAHDSLNATFETSSGTLAPISLTSTRAPIVELTFATTSPVGRSDKAMSAHIAR